MYTPYFNRFRKENLHIQSKTIHAAKGLEAKVVFIIGLTEGYGGFPDIWLEDRIFQIIKQANHDLLLEEERRLFYVAITRAKDKLFLITEKGNESSFLKEIPETFTVKTSVALQPVVEKVITCKKCFSRLEKLWVICPYCKEEITSWKAGQRLVVRSVLTFSNFCLLCSAPKSIFNIFPRVNQQQLPRSVGRLVNGSCLKFNV